MKATDLDDKNSPPCILIFGPAGTFKTGLVAQASGAYLFDFDGGMDTAKTMQDKFTPLRHQIEFDTYIDEVPSRPTAWTKAQDKMRQFVNDSARGKFPYDGIVIDSLTGVTKAVQLHTMSCVAGDSFAKPEIQHWYAMVLAIEKILTQLRGIKTMVIVTAHELLVEKDKKNTFLPMSITTKHSINKLQWLFGEIWHSSITLGAGGTTKWTLSSKPNPMIRCKTRRGFPHTFIHDEVGLKGVLETIGYDYGNVETKQ